MCAKGLGAEAVEAKNETWAKRPVATLLVLATETRHTECPKNMHLFN